MPRPATVLKPFPAKRSYFQGNPPRERAINMAGTRNYDFLVRINVCCMFTCRLTTLNRSNSFSLVTLVSANHVVCCDSAKTHSLRPSSQLSVSTSKFGPLTLMARGSSCKSGIPPVKSAFGRSRRHITEEPWASCWCTMSQTRRVLTVSEDCLRLSKVRY